MKLRDLFTIILGLIGITSVGCGVSQDSPVSVVSDAQLRSEMDEFVFRPCIEAAIPSGGLADMSNTEAIEIGSALLADRLAPVVLNQVRGESLRENREIYYSNYRDVCIEQYGDMFE